MALTIFFSWQSDSPSNSNRNFIEDALKRAIVSLKADAEIEEALRDEEFAVDRDTQGVPGSPPIVEAIFDKISRCGIFVPDLTFVASTAAGRKVPNPNVLIEYGWALRAIGHHRVIPVMNAAYFEPTPESLPFDMRHLRGPLRYKLSTEADSDERKRVREGLVKDLAEAIRLIVSSGRLADSLPRPAQFKEAEPKWRRSSFVAAGEKLLTPRDTSSGKPLKDVNPLLGPHMYLRLVPTQVLGKEWTPVELEHLVKEQREQTFALPPMGSFRGFDYGLNRLGFVVFDSRRDESIAYLFTQLFRTGEIWAVDAKGLRSWNEEYPRPPISFQFERAFADALSTYRRFAMERLKIKPPYRWIAGMNGIEGREIELPPPRPGRTWARPTAGACLVDEIEKDGLIGADDDAAKALLPFFEALWAECGLSRSKVWEG